MLDKELIFLDNLCSYLLFSGFGLIFTRHWLEMVLEQVVKFLGKRAKISIVCIFDHCGSHDCFEELTLEDDSKFNDMRYKIRIQMLTYDWNGCHQARFQAFCGVPPG